MLILTTSQTKGEITRHEAQPAYLAEGAAAGECLRCGCTVRLTTDEKGRCEQCWREYDVAFIAVLKERGK